MDNKAVYGASGSSEPNKPPDPVPVVPSRPATVLIVDDEPEVRQVVTRILQRSGYAICCVADGQSAIEQVAQADPQIDCVLLDMTMLGLSGLQTFALLQSGWPSLPVVLMSGYAESDMIRGLDLHYPSVFVQKPFNIADLQRTVAQLIAYGSGRAT